MTPSDDDVEPRRGPRAAPRRRPPDPEGSPSRPPRATPRRPRLPAEPETTDRPSDWRARLGLQPGADPAPEASAPEDDAPLDPGVTAPADGDDDDLATLAGDQPFPGAVIVAGPTEDDGDDEAGDDEPVDRPGRRQRRATAPSPIPALTDEDDLLDDADDDDQDDDGHGRRLKAGSVETESRRGSGRRLKRPDPAVASEPSDEQLVRPEEGLDLDRAPVDPVDDDDDQDTSAHAVVFGEPQESTFDGEGRPPRWLIGAAAALVLAVLVGLLVWVLDRNGGDGQDIEAVPTIRPAAQTSTTVAPQPSQPVEEPPPGDAVALTGTPGPSAQTSLVRVQRLTGDMAPKSVVAAHRRGLLFAQNMMYRHTISVFRADGALVKTIPDSVDLGALGVSGHPGTTKGAPVEMAFSPDDSTAWVSNYSMYGEGFGSEGSDACTPQSGTSDSYLYRVDVNTLKITAAVKVGAVPKYVAVTPDNTKVLVTNWCTWDLSVVDVASAKEVARIPLGGRYPRGIVVSPDSKTAYIALMGSHRVVQVDLATNTMSLFAQPGAQPRHLNISPDGAFIYVSNNTGGNVVKLDRATGRMVGSVATGSQPRSMAISPDGGALYVVNYNSGTMSKVRTSDMTVIDQVPTDNHPIGVTYEPTKQRVWVACYGGSIIVYDDSRIPSAATG